MSLGRVHVVAYQAAAVGFGAVPDDEQSSAKVGFERFEEFDDLFFAHRAFVKPKAQRGKALKKRSRRSATIGIRGTSFGLQYCNNDCGGLKTVQGAPPANGLHADVSDGSIVVTNQGGSLVVSIGQFAYVQTPATPPVPVPANQALPPALLPQALTSQLSGGTVGVSGTLECAF